MRWAMKTKRKTKEQIRESLSDMILRNRERTSKLSGKGNLCDYASLVRTNENGYLLFTDAIQKAIDENEIVVISELRSFKAELMQKLRSAREVIVHR